MLRGASRGAWVGASAAAVVAFGDIAGSWLATSDPVTLAIALAGVIVGAGAAAGALLGAFGAFGSRAVARIEDERHRRRAWPLPFVVLASPALAAVAFLLFTGGSASRVPLIPLWIGAAFAALGVGLYVALRLGRALVERAGSRWTLLAVAALVVTHAALTVADRWVLPGLYDYLHALATAARWATAGLAILVLAARTARVVRLEQRFPRAGVIAAAALVALLAVDLYTLGALQTVRVTMLSPRAPASRSLMMALAPAVALAERPTASTSTTRGPIRGVDGASLPGVHVLLITIDALRADHLGAYGYRERPTSPALDRLAAGSVVFERAYAQAPHSSYSISSLMSSDYLAQRTDLDQPLPEATIASALAAVGYHTAAFYTQGIFHTEGERLARYRDEGFGFAARSYRLVGGAETTTREVLAELDAVAQSGEQPTFVWAHYFDVHEPYEDTRFGTRDVERYDSEIRHVDAEVERLIAAARDRLRRPVVVVITADHGEEFRDHGGVYHGSTVYDEQVRVPLIVNAPGVEPARIAAPVELVDVGPTLLGMLDVAVPPSMRGDDLRALIADPSADAPPVFASAGTRHMVVEWPYKLIVDLRFGTRELYDLAADPRERTNLADDRPDRVASLRAQIGGWLDGMAEDTVDPRQVALYRGRLRDRRAIDPLAAILRDETAPARMRAEAAELLGRLPAVRSRDALARVLHAAPPVGTEAAIALGRLDDRRSAARLRALVADESSPDRARASLALADLGDRAAVPGLLDALDGELSSEDRVEAVRQLGLLGDRRATDGLVDLLDDPHLGRRAALALGRIGDPEAREPLLDALDDTDHATTREAIARAIGALGDPRDVPLLVRLAATDDMPSAVEALVRVGAVGSAIGGADVGPDLRGATGLDACEARRADDEWRYLGRTTCRTRGARVELPVAAPSSPANGHRLVILRARRADTGAPVRARVRLDDGAPRTLTIDGEWREQRWTTPGGTHQRATIEIDDDARLELDHLIVVPGRSDFSG